MIIDFASQFEVARWNGGTLRGGGALAQNFRYPFGYFLVEGGLLGALGAWNQRDFDRLSQLGEMAKNAVNE